MAVYYKWIKGCGTNASTNILENATWTYVNWASPTSTPKNTCDLSPVLESRVGKNGTSTELGYILTNNITGVKIQQPWTFNKPITINGTTLTGKSTTIDQNTTYSFDINQPTKVDTSLTTDDFYGKALNIKNTTGDNEIQVETTINNSGIQTHRITIGASDEKNSYRDEILTVYGITKSYGRCEAQYFNATSDKRAKENISIADFSALSVVNNTPVYTFNYKNNPDKVSGIIAQDLLKSQPSDLSLVDNTNASGENGDYMSIKSDKLVFILWKAIQEQDAKIKELEEKLAALTK